jgi:hypothetical protein
MRSSKQKIVQLEINFCCNSLKTFGKANMSIAISIQVKTRKREIPVTLITKKFLLNIFVFSAQHLSSVELMISLDFP